MPVILLPWAYQPLSATPQTRTGPQPERQPALKGYGHDGFNFNTADEIKGILGSADVRSITPRKMSDLSRNLYEAGHISFREHALLSFQPGLQHGNGASQQLRDQPRNYIDTWEQQLDEQSQHQARPDFIKQTRRILNLLNNLDALARPSRRDPVG